MNPLDLYETVLQPAEVILAEIERTGIPIDLGRVCDLAEHLSRDLEGLEGKLRALTGKDLNPRSPQQVAALLYDDLGLAAPPVTGTSRAVKLAQDGERSTSEAALAWLEERASGESAQIIRLLREHKRLSKVVGFVGSLPDHAIGGRVHTTLAPVTETGRLASKNPNLQQIPPQVRECFVAPDGYAFLSVDYSALEWRILAHHVAKRYGDTSLVDDLEAGVDPHGAMAVKVFGLDCQPHEVRARYPELRQAAKVLVYSVNYGKSPAGLGVAIRGSDGSPIGREKGLQMLRAFYRANPGILRFHQDTLREALSCGYVTSLLGRRRPLDRQQILLPWNPGDKLTKPMRQALNRIQNDAADVVTLAMLKTYPCPEDHELQWRYPRRWGCPTLHELGARMVLQIHDELLFLVPEGSIEHAAEVTQSVMRDAVRLHCPLETSAGWAQDWSGAHGG